MTNIDDKENLFSARVRRETIEVDPNFWTYIEVIRRPKFSDQKQKTKSWIFDPLFMGGNIYGLELQLTPKFSWKFLLTSGTCSLNSVTAFMEGIKFRDSLRERFPGIVAKVSVVSVLPNHHNRNKRLREVILPRRGDFYYGKVNLFQKLINFAWLNRTKRNVTAYIFWERDPNHKNYPALNLPSPEERFTSKWSEKCRKHYLKYYKIRILINVELENSLDSNRDDLELLGQLETLTSEIQNSYGNGAIFELADENTWSEILNDNIFKENHVAFIKPKEFDFEFLDNVPLKKPLWLDDENVELEPYNVSDPEKINIGSLLYRGDLTTHKKPMKINNFHQRVLIAGNNGVGKTSFTIDLLKQIYEKRKDIGFIYINTVKPDQDKFFKMGKIMDLLIKWKTPECHVPYYTKDSNIYDTARYIIVQLGLKNFFESNLVEVFDFCIKEHGTPPKSIEVLLYNLVEFIRSDKDLDTKTKNRRISYLMTQIAKITRDKNIVKSLELNDEIPYSFTCLMNGGGIFLDLCECKSREAQRLFLCAFFNYLKCKLPQTNKLKVIIAIDEAHRLFQEQTGQHVHDDDFISFKGFQDFTAELIEESRSQGISFMFIDQDPKLLMSKVRSAPMVHFIFSLDEDNAKLLAHNKDQEDLINNLGNREVFCRNKITKERFVFHTNNIVLDEYK